MVQTSAATNWRGSNGEAAKWYLRPRVTYSSGSGGALWDPHDDDVLYEDDGTTVLSFPDVSATSRGAGMPTGLGLLLSGGYLTQQGASVLDCPSRHLPDPEAGYPEYTDSGTTYKVLPWTNEQVQFNPAAVFFTTGGKVLWGSSDDDWKMVISPYSSTYDPNTPARWWDYQVWQPHGSLDAGHPNCPYGIDAPCGLLGSYQVRPDNGAEYSNESYPLDEIAGQAVASDSIWGFFHLWGNGTTVDRGSIRIGSTKIPFSFNDPTHLTKRWWTSNHDMAYNVLFADGAVKTYSDSGLSLLKSVAAYKTAWAGAPVSPEGEAVLFETYFDPLYAQD